MPNGLKTFGVPVAGVVYKDRPGAYAFIKNSSGELAVVATTMGLFLPGGGLEPGEDELIGLKREVFEEIRFEIIRATLVVRSAQYHWSEFYQQHFKKIGAFFAVEAKPPAIQKCQSEHSLIWMKPEQAATKLSQEFQRWAVQKFLNPEEK